MQDNYLLSMEKTLDSEDIFKSFNNDLPIWPEDDPWHLYTRKKIESFVVNQSAIIERSELIINAGSSGESYGIPDEKVLHIDIISERIKFKPLHLVSTVESVPLKSEYTDLIICVGSVINYTDSIKVISEFSRLLKKGGHLILEFECSNTLELLFSKQFNANVTIRETFYRDKKETIYYYSEDWINNLLIEDNFKILSLQRWHIISPLIYRTTSNSKFSSWFSKFDSLATHVPFLKNLCSNKILLCQKN